MSHWLNLYVWPTAVHAMVYTASGALVTAVIIMPMRKLFKKIWRAIDSLDPDTDTGITKELRELRHRDFDAPLDHHRH